MATITVTNVNDLAPVFDQDMYYGSVDENEPIGTSVGIVISAVDPDVPSNLISYSISNHGDQLFTINSTTGEITTAQILDADTLPVHVILAVIAEDTDGNTVTSSSAVVNITVNDMNDNSPVFEQDMYHIESLLENVSVNTSVLNISATDIDRSNLYITYSIVDDSNSVFGLLPNTGSGIIDNFPFAIDPISGTISVSKPLDYETVRYYNFTVRATDSGYPPRATNVPVTISISDVNDNAPYFINTPYSIAVSEVTAIGQHVLTVQAVDNDSGINSAITYTIYNTTLFTVHPTTGIVTVLEQLDYETTPNVIFTIQATDGGSVRLSSTAAINISITNENDNPPMFTESQYTFEVNENTQFDITPTAVDPDNDLLNYVIITSCKVGVFIIDPLTGRVSTIQTLDHETTPTCTLTLGVSDGTFNDTADVIITVMDLNDNPPIFSSPVYSVSISEVAPINSTVISLTATDNDSGTNSYIAYSIVTGNINNTFFMSTDGVLKVNRPLDFEHISMYNLTVIASDGGSPSLTGTTTVFVNITDHNDVSPVILLANNQISYQEQSGVIDLAGDINVIDPDTNLLQEATVVFSTVSDCPLVEHNSICPNDLVCFYQCNEALMLSKNELGSLNVTQTNINNHLFINISGESTANDYQNVLSSLQYINYADEPYIGIRIVEISVFDGEHFSNVLPINITIDYINDHCPIVYSNGTNVTYTEDMIDTLHIGQLLQLTISDKDILPLHQSISHLTVSIVGIKDGLHEDFSVNTSNSPPALVVSKMTTPTSQLISIYGDASVKTYASLLQTLQYSNLLTEPTPGVRYITITPSQSGINNCTNYTISLSVIPINDHPPLITLNNTSLIVYQEESGLLPFAEIAGLVISDSDLHLPLVSAKISLYGVQDGVHESLVFSNTLLDTGISVNHTDSTDIVLTGSNTAEVYQYIIYSVYYINTALEPSPGIRNISITLSDGAHETVNVISILVAVRNDNPLQLTANILNYVFYEGNTSIPIAGLVLSDVDDISLIYSLNISLVGADVNESMEYLSVEAFGNTTISPIVLNSVSTLAEYQVRERDRKRERERKRGREREREQYTIHYYILFYFCR